jgi:hypothetical protein
MMKALIIAMSIVILTGCTNGGNTHGVTQAHIDKATELCAANGGITIIKLASRDAGNKDGHFFVYVQCENSAEFKVNFTIDSKR